ncbi:MAG: hypothetical protein JWP85_142 [Rhodoglobus sp.]|nr:hypothetical protein [Rhodoglobus sp.]
MNAQSFSLDTGGERSLSVTAGDSPLFTYVFLPDDVALESPRPYIHPLRTLGGRVVTAFRPHDHVWHKGISWSLPHVSGENFWGGPTYVHGQGYVQLANNGRVEHEGFFSLDVSATGVEIGHTLCWTGEAGGRFFHERRQLSARIVGDGRAWVLVFETSMKNVSGRTLALGSPTTAGRENAGYGGLFWRGPRSFTGGTILTPAGSGGDEARGAREVWMGFSGKHDEFDAQSTIVMVDHPENPRHPPQWFARSAQYPGLCPAPFFSDELHVEADQVVRFRYAVVVADGPGDAGAAAELAYWGREALAGQPA